MGDWSIFAPHEIRRVRVRVRLRVKVRVKVRVRVGWVTVLRK